ncbi:hypothetical protein [Streptomyces sp. NPDC001530]|uniref:hypothetical protein n=1 Tax=Streptomyces sp. NPDC001530 TaxID=3364582 RepID=UPI0036B15E12
MPAPQEPPPDPQPPPPRPPKSAFLEKAAYIAAPGTVVIGLLYYFGSTYTQAYYATLGVPSQDLQFSFQGIVAKSPKAIFLPLWFLLVCGLIVLLVLGWVGQALAVPEHAARRRTVIRWLLSVGLVLVLLGFPIFFWDQLLSSLPGGWWRQFLSPLVVALGATLAFFAVQLRLGQGRGVRNRQARTGDRLWLASGALLIGLLTMSLFFEVAWYTAEAGRTDAVRNAEGGYLDSPQVLIHSRVPLSQHAQSIGFTDLGSGTGPYRYQYRGFRMLAKSPTRFYLVSYASRYKDRMVVVLPDDDTLRVEIRS